MGFITRLKAKAADTPVLNLSPLPIKRTRPPPPQIHPRPPPLRLRQHLQLPSRVVPVLIRLDIATLLLHIIVLLSREHLDGQVHQKEGPLVPPPVEEGVVREGIGGERAVHERSGGIAAQAGGEMALGMTKRFKVSR
ncbi:MAG: hypothetical protein Q9207_000362 [Kuettlingeria erythrocarpa]